MKKSIGFLGSLICIILFLYYSSPAFAQTYALTGRVYEGNTGVEPPTSSPLAGVTVKLWGANTSGVKDIQISSTSTNSEGWYSLSVNVSTYAYDYYIIEETDPGGYYSVGATSVSGKKLTNNQIEYDFDDLSGTLTGNKFWDKKQNNDPVADAGGPYSGTAGQTITLDGSGSYDSDGSISLYEWDINGDGDYNDAGDKTGQTVQNTWTSAGTYTVNLRVTDNDGATDTDQATVTISADVMPVADAGGPYSGTVGQAITLDGSGSTPGDGTNTYEWDIDGDGIYGESGETGQTVQYTWAAAGTYTVYLRVTDSDGDQSSDAATVTISAGGSTEYDYGDAPDGIGIYKYPTLKSNNGAYHGYDPDVYLGTAWDSESDGQTTSDASGDDTDADGDDEDGVTFSGSLVPGTNHTVTVTASIEGNLSAWIDFNGDGDWADAHEQVFSDEALTSGPNTLTFAVPGDAKTGQTFTRFRFSTGSITAYTGGMADGEVEDYQVTISSDTGLRDYGDAPYDGSTYKYPSASHLIGNTYFGDNVSKDGAPDAESGMQYSSDASGDDNDGYDDEGHIKFKFNVKGKKWWEWSAEFVSLNSASGWISYAVFIDWNQDGDWDDSGEQDVGGYSVFPWAKHNNIGFGSNMPSSAKNGKTFARCRIIEGSVYPISPGGDLGVGEVCDFEIEVTSDGDPVTDTGYIWGRKWHDQNGDGNWDATEPGLAGWEIWLDLNQNGVEDTGDQYTTTDSDGHFSFIGIPGGTYTVGEDLQPGWVQTCPGTETDPQTISVTVDTKNASPLGIYFGNKEEESPQGRDYGDAPYDGSTYNYPSASHLLGGPFFQSHSSTVAGSGSPDAETGMQRSLSADGDDIDGNDDEDGFCDFYQSPINPAIWYLIIDYRGFRKVASWVTIGVWVDLDRNGDWNNTNEQLLFSTSGPSSRMCYMIYRNSWTPGPSFIRLRIIEGQNAALTADGDFGPGEVEDHPILFPDNPGSDPGGGAFSGRKWNDLNGDGFWDLGEPVLAGWTIWLDDNQNGVIDAGEQTSVTDNMGHYFFTGLAAGTYTVAEEPKSGWSQTYPGGPGTHTITVSPPVSIGPSYDFGNTEDGTAGFNAVKWQQPVMSGAVPEQDTVALIGTLEASMNHMPLVADDWFCWDPRPVTAIRWWGAYTDWDNTFAPNNAPASFHLGIWTDVPYNDSEPLSHPGELIHEWIVPRGDLGERRIRGLWTPERPDSMVTGFEYTFSIPNPDWFYQEGDSTLYWLSIAALYDEMPDSFQWGWITREHHFHSDAERIDFDSFPEPGAVPGGFEPLGFRRDLAFVLGTESGSYDFDFGDAPWFNYATTRAGNGAYHRIVQGLHMGDAVDGEEDGLPHDQALGDDQDGMDDEDGVSMAETMMAGQENEITVSLSGRGYLNGWLDMAGDGNWHEPGDYVLEDIELPAGEHRLGIFIPQEASPGITALRIRFSTEPHLWFNGFAMDGEVEDYLVTIGSGTHVKQEHTDIPGVFRLQQNYPNPFNPATRLMFDLPERSDVELAVYDMTGRKIEILINETMAAGRHTCFYKAGGLCSGVYVYVITARSCETGTEYRQMGKMLLLR